MCNEHRISPKLTWDFEMGISVVVKWKGVRVFDQHDKGYIDLVSRVTRLVHVGIGRREIAQAVYDQICELSYFTPMQFANVPALKLAEILAGIAQGKINRFFFVCAGSEAVEPAIKLAKHYHAFRGKKRRYKIISMRGHTMGNRQCIKRAGNNSAHVADNGAFCARNDICGAPLLLSVSTPFDISRLRCCLCQGYRKNHRI